VERKANRKEKNAGRKERLVDWKVTGIESLLLRRTQLFLSTIFAPRFTSGGDTLAGDLSELERPGRDKTRRGVSLRAARKVTAMHY